MSTSYIYPEIARLRRATTYIEPHGGRIEVPADDRPVVFPAACPACGAAKTSERPYRDCTYSCGGAYREKPQIQNHTDKWWGSCPASQDPNDRH